MEYLPGNIHESYQTEISLSMLNDFVICLCNKRYSDTDMINDSEITGIELKQGDVVIVRWFKPPSKYGDSLIYTYIDRIITDVKDINIKSESILSMDFIDHNIQNSVLFNRVALDYIRDKKINQIISQ